jgi:hypothetical protein
MPRGDDGAADGAMRTTNAPYFDFARASWIPASVTWDPESGAFVRVEGPAGFTTWREAEAEAVGRFLRHGAHSSDGQFGHSAMAGVAGAIEPPDLASLLCMVRTLLSKRCQQMPVLLLDPACGGLWGESCL